MAPPRDARAATDAFDDHISLAGHLERLGWHSYFTIEHQSNPGNLTSAPSVYLAAVARETSKLRIGAMMWQLPFYQPMRLAAEIATLWDAGPVGLLFGREDKGLTNEALDRCHRGRSRRRPRPAR